MDTYDEIFDDEKDEIMRDLRERQAEVREMYKRFDANPHLWKEHRDKLESGGCRFIDYPADAPR